MRSAARCSSTANDVAILDLNGKLTIGKGDVILRETLVEDEGPSALDRLGSLDQQVERESLTGVPAIEGVVVVRHLQREGARAALHLELHRRRKAPQQRRHRRLIEPLEHELLPRLRDQQHPVGVVRGVVIGGLALNRGKLDEHSEIFAERLVDAVAVS